MARQKEFLPTLGVLSLERTFEYPETDCVGLVGLRGCSTGSALTRGRCLEGQVGAHNMCVVQNPEATAALRAAYDPRGTYLVFAVGGEYRDPRDSRGRSATYDGISLYGLKPASKH